jgi:hypothetical protein
MADEATPFDVLGAGAGGPLTAPSPWLVSSGWITYPGGIVVGSPSGGNKGAGVLNTADLYVNGVHFLPALYLPLTGGTLSGPLLQAADPVNPLGTATKQYVDGKFTVAYLPLSGGTMTGTLTLAADPAAALSAATKQYVDARTPLTTDAPSDNNYYSRQNGAWAVAPGGLSDSPRDGSTYGRNNGIWSNVFDAGTF